MKIENVALDLLSLDPLNARAHNPKNLDAVKASLKNFGQQKPIVALRNGVVIAGNGTLMAAKALGLTHLWVKYFEDAKLARAYAIADNRTAELADWDGGQLLEGLKDFKDTGGDLADLGFSGADFDGLQAEIDKQERANSPSFREKLNYNLTFELVFETHAAQKEFYDLIRVLNKTRTETTVSGRLTGFLKDQLKDADAHG